MVERLRGGGVTRIASPQMAEDYQASEVVDLAEFPFELAGTSPNFQYLSLIHISEPTRPY